MSLIYWISIVWLVSSSLTAVPLHLNRRAFIAASVSGEKLATVPKSVMASRAPIIAEEAYSTSRTAEASSLSTIAVPNLESTKSLPKKPAPGSESLSLSLDIPEKDSINHSQSPNLQSSKGMTETEVVQAKVLTSSQSQKATSQIPGKPKPGPPDKLNRGLSGRWSYYLKKKMLKTMKSNRFTIIYLFKAIMKKIKFYSPRRYASEKSAAERAPIGRKASGVKKLPYSPSERTGVQKEGVEAIGSETSVPELANLHGTDKNLAHKIEQSYAPPVTSWSLYGISSKVYNSLVDTIRTRLPRGPTQSSTPEATSQALAKVTKPTDSESISPASASTSHLDEISGSESSVDKLEHPQKESELKEPPSPTIDKTPPLVSWSLYGIPSKVYNSLIDTIRTRLPRGPTPSSPPESTSQAWVKVSKPSDSESISPAPTSASHLDEISGRESSVEKVQHSQKALDSEEPPPPGIVDKQELARAQLARLVDGILQPIVSRYLTPEKTSRFVDKSLRKKKPFVRWAASWVPDKYPHNFIRDKVAPPFVRAFASKAARIIMRISPDNIFELLQQHSIQFLATVNKANVHNIPHPG
ncbi:hypothetical protein PtA15_1A367 [Puccinia triticina]|uniref:Uncharacterized protein n=1 Tax=Puccinia triticina TaxID=208348 RepID=A0ABY7C7A9_9BASI|nr:uncharacterized protein PtA15_1A367 [Puccinia triticina]WAQ81029.1 hypothetical protein PtA15_1A367 [Puccinia triticina]